MTKPWLWLPARVAHDLSPLFLQAYSFLREPVRYEWRPFAWQGLQFANRLGLAGGVDKDAGSIRAWWALGAGFVEIGTVTPQPQGPNPGRIMARDSQNLALWNKMGFPSAGMEKVARNLARLPRPYHTPVFINIGKNRTTTNEYAAQDYVACMRQLAPFADAFVVNISSPNTTGLRDLLKRENLRKFLEPIVSERARLPKARATSLPLLLKLSPDLQQEDLASALETSLDLQMDGWIVSNTTLQRGNDSPFPNEGGVSGGPLAALSLEILRKTLALLGTKRQGKLLISAGGILSAKDVRERLELGADLVQVYSALIFQGPGFFKDVARQMTGT